MAAMMPEQGIGRAQVQGAGGEAETVARCNPADVVDEIMTDLSCAHLA